MKLPMNRRDVVKSGLMLLGAGALPALERRALAQGEGAHFFIYVNLFPGACGSNLFDARPLALTAAGKMQNFYGVEPSVWEGTNGGKALATASTDPLKPFRDKFSIVNGVQMATTFDGHEQNQGFIFTGSPFGGESFLPHLNAKSRLPLDSLSLFEIFGVNITNNSASLTTNEFTLASLPRTFDVPGIDEATAKLVRARYENLQQGTGNLSTGARQLLSGFDASGSLGAKLRGMTFEVSQVFNPETGTLVETGTPVNLQVVAQFLKQGIARSLHLGITDNYDVHDNMSCKKQPETFKRTSERLAMLLKFMQDTPFDEAAGKSLLDVTTFVVGSEFSRTMRQLSAPTIEQTGTDHNPLTNSFLIGGKGIKGGLVIGASDLTEVDAEGHLLGVSGAHKQLDKDLIKIMAKPFDFETFAPRADLPEQFDNQHYLSFNALANTVYRVFGFAEADVPFRRFSAGGNVVPALKPLLG